MKYILSLVFFFSLLGQSYGQVIGDALRYAFTNPEGTARTLGIGGGIGAIGADFSTMSTNPAGLGWYRRSEMVITPSLTLSNAESLLAGGELRDRSRSNVNVNNFGFVIKGRDRTSALRSLNFAFGYNRTANFYQDNNFAGTTPGSITDRFLELTSDGNPNTPNLTPDELDNFEAGLAFEAGALLSSQDAVGDYFYGTDFLPGEEVEKSQINQNSGGINELTFSLAGNIEEKLLLGATLGVPLVSYSEVKTYRERDEDDSTPFFESLEFEERLTQTGSGVNLKVGAIYRALQSVRIGLAVHTPTSFRLEDNFTTRLTYAFNEGNGVQSFDTSSPDGSFEYRVNTPAKFIGSAAFIIGRRGFLTAEVEYQDFASTEFNFNNTTSDADLAYEAELNRQIQDSYKSAVNIKLGGEFAYENLRLRAGYGLIGSPYVEGDAFYNALSLGVGLRQKSFYMDLGYRRSSVGETYVPYVIFDKETFPEQEVTNEFTTSTFLLTFGFRF